MIGNCSLRWLISRCFSVLWVDWINNYIYVHVLCTKAVGIWNLVHHYISKGIREQFKMTSISKCTFACFISSSAISIRFFLKATTRLALKPVSSMEKILSSKKKKKKHYQIVQFIPKEGFKVGMEKDEYMNPSFPTLKACQISADSVSGAPLPVECPCSSAVPYLRPCWNSHSQLTLGLACRGDPDMFHTVRH